MRQARRPEPPAPGPPRAVCPGRSEPSAQADPSRLPRPILPPPGRPEPSAQADPASHPRSLSYGRRVKLRRIRAVCPAAGAAVPSRRTLAAVQDLVRLGLAGATHPVQRSTRAHMARRRPRRHHPRRMPTTRPDAPPASRMRHHPAGCATTQPNARSRADVRRCTEGNQGSQWRRTRHPIGLFAALRATDSPRSSGVGSPVADLLSPGQQAGPVDRPTALDSAWSARRSPDARRASEVLARPRSGPSPPLRRIVARLRAMSGPVALLGADEFLPAVAALDAELLAATGRARPRVAILPTASAPDGEDVFRRWAAMGIEHFEALGAEVEAVLVHDRAEADDPASVQAVAEADLVYMSGGDPGHLYRSLAGSALWSAALDVHRRGGVLAGCSAGAMVLCGTTGAVPTPAAPAAPLRPGARGRAGGRGAPALRQDAGVGLHPDDPPRAARNDRARARRGDRGRGP